MPNDLAARALSADDGISRADYFDADLTQPIPNGTSRRRRHRDAGHEPLHARRRRRRHDRSEREAVLRARVRRSASSAKSCRTRRLGVRYINRRIPRVLEDVANCPMVAYEFSAATASVCGTVEYILTNPTSATPINPALLAIAPQFIGVQVRRSGAQVRRRRVHAEPPLGEQLVDGRVVPLVAAARQLRRVLPRRQRPVGSGHHVALRLPDQRSDLHRRSATASGTGDIRYLGDANGILPLDRPHQGKMFGNYMFPIGLNIGVGLNISSGKPLTRSTPNPNYTQRRRDSGRAARLAASRRSTASRRGRRSRARSTSRRRITSSSAALRRVTLMADMFNLFNQQTVARLRQLDVDVASAPGRTQLRHCATSSLFAGNPAAVPDAAADPVRRPVRVLIVVVSRNNGGPRQRGSLFLSVEVCDDEATRCPRGRSGAPRSLRSPPRNA